jgi:sugar lactone lactonase YvrE
VVGLGKLPTRCVTCAVFVREELFITSDADPYFESPEFSRSVVMGGILFRIGVGVKGRMINRWKGLDPGNV